MSAPLRIAAIEPYFGGSHRAFLEGLKKHSRHAVDLFTLPPRLWKWRMRGSALHLARAVNAQPPYDVFLASDFVNVPDFRALLTPAQRVRPLLYYLHENQLSYPLSPDEIFDPYFGFTNVLSCLSAEAVAFNSDFHRRELLGKLPGFLPRLPDYEPAWVVEQLTTKSEVLPVGLDLEELQAGRPATSSHNVPRRILWNHRWEFDKCPEIFFAALKRLAERQVPFAVDVVGESFARRPAIFDEACEKLAGHIGHFGYLPSRRQYVRVLWQSDIVVSTAMQEFFGISMAEAVWCGAHPIAPRALVYQDLYGGPGSEARLYESEEHLDRILERALTVLQPPDNTALRNTLRALGWQQVAGLFDDRFEELASRHG